MMETVTTTPAVKGRPWGCYIGLLFVLGIVAIISFPIVVGILHTIVPESTKFEIPGTEYELLHSRIGINPIVAEYNRDITYIHKGIEGKTTPLTIDTCGGYPVNCYLIETPSKAFLRMDDATAEHLLDLTSQETYLVTRFQGKAYVGELTHDSMSSGWSMHNNDPTTLIVTIDGEKAVPMSQLTGDAQEVYVGRLTPGFGNLSFLPAAEANEVKIHHLFED
jgi:hypothetical protein